MTASNASTALKEKGNPMAIVLPTTSGSPSRTVMATLRSVAVLVAASGLAAGVLVGLSTVMSGRS